MDRLEDKVCPLRVSSDIASMAWIFASVFLLLAFTMTRRGTCSSHVANQVFQRRYELDEKFPVKPRQLVRWYVHVGGLF